MGANLIGLYMTTNGLPARWKFHMLGHSVIESDDCTYQHMLIDERSGDFYYRDSN